MTVRLALLFAALLLRGADSIERLIDLGRLDEARSRLRALPAEAPGGPGRAALLEAMILYRESKPAESLRQLDPLLASGSAPAAAHKLAALSLVALGRADEAGARIREAVRLNPDDFMAQYYLGLHQLDKRMPEQAAATFEAAIRLSPEYPDLYTMLGMAHEQLGRDDEALANYRKGVELTARFRIARESAYVYLGRYLHTRHQNQEAARQIERAVRINARSAEAWFLLGKTRSALALHEQAIEALRQAAQLAPNDKRIRFQLMQTYQRMGRSVEARREKEFYEKMAETESGRWEEKVSGTVRK